MTASRNPLLFVLAFVLILLGSIPVLCAVAVPDQSNAEQGLKAVPVLVNERYCYGDAEVFVVWLKLSVKYTNRTSSTKELEKHGTV
jgi:hypothetical protein